ncbi:MAG: protein phosphatase 2C domain-containing protein [Caldiserica bacterium]|jgi:serine/threonine protein phosphatase PrpC/sugar lactone lactonase YvrE|nr:protein phosphatase 2C domain-containing protein [Caldisericota bacterium]MDH7562684.1 protein phosphatase 2C domain-containing protein [Caldisericota bacterium]
MEKGPLISIGMVTDPGKKSVNEDAYYILEDRASPEGPLLNGLYAVADAESKDRMGEAAARLLLSTIAEKIEPLFNQEHESFLVELKKAIQEGYGRLRELSKNEGWKGISVSLACAVIYGYRLYYSILGSCAIFHLRDGELKKLVSGTPEEMEEITPEGELVSPEVFEIKLAPGDSLLFATDGLSDRVRMADIGEVLQWSISPQAAVERLVSLAKRAGGEDNITGVAVEILEETKPGGYWWKIGLSLLGLLAVGFLLSFLIFWHREAPPPSPTETISSSYSARFRFIEDLRDPYAILQWDKNLFVLDKEEKRVRKFVEGKEDLGFDGYLPAADAPCDMVASSRYIYIVDASGKFFYLDPEKGNPVMLLPEMGDKGSLSSPRAIEYDGTYFYVADRGNDRIVIFNRDFKYLEEYSGEAEDGSPIFEKPNGLALDEKGNLYVSLKNRHEVLKVDYRGNVVATATTGATSVGTYDGPSDLALTYSGEVLVPEMSTNQILVFDSDLNLISKISPDQLEDPAFRDPKGLCATSEALYVVGGSSEDLEGYVWRIPWNLFSQSP